MRIICKDLSFSYSKSKKHKEYALNNLSLTIEEGEFFGIIGQTGSGKSTFIQHLNAILPVQEGELIIGEYDLDPRKKGYKKMLKSLRSKVGMVFQYPEYQLFAESVYADVAFGVKNFFPELSDREVTMRVGDALTAVGLNYNEIKDASPFDLSGGQKRRVAIAGVLATSPEILVLDEPVAGLDPVGKKELMTLLKNQLNGKRTIIIVSHDMDEVCENCTKVAAFLNGNLYKCGTPEEVFTLDLEEKRLLLPLTAKIKNTLKQNGVELNCSLKPDDLVEEIARVYKNRKS